MKRFLLLIFAYSLTSSLVFSQFEIDSSFNTYNNNDITNVQAVVKQGGKLILAGAFTKIAGVQCSNICRMLNDSVVDPTFMSGTGFNGVVKKMILLPNNKLMVMGMFTSYSTANINYLMRLNSNGTPDLTFTPNFDASSVLNDFVIQADGKVIVVGRFNTYSGNPRKNLVRLTSNGSLDMGFIWGDTNNGDFNRVAIQSTGNIIITGLFSSHLTVPLSGIVRLLPTGEVDATFSCILANGSFNFVVLTDLFIHPNDEISLPRIDTNPRTFLRLNANGDVLYNYPFTINEKSVLLENGNFLTIPNYIPNYTNKSFPVEISPNGTIVKKYTAVGWYNQRDGSYTDAIPLFEVDGKVYMSCNYYEDYTEAKRNLIRLTENNKVDYHFLPIGGPNYSVTELVKYDADSYIMIGGFTRVGSNQAQTIAMVDKTCKVESTFNAGAGFNGPALCAAVQQDGKIIVGGAFTKYNNQPANRLVRLMADGTIDPSFNVGTGPDYTIYDIHILDADHILLGGNFSSYQGLDAFNLVCLKNDGSLNTAYNSNLGASSNGRVRKIKTIGSKIYLIGDFNFFDGNSRKHIARINVDGTFDASFDPGQGDNGLVNDVTEFENKLYVVGKFTQFASQTANSMVVLNMNGTVDISQDGFDQGSGIINVEVLSNSLICTASGNGIPNFWAYSSYALTKQGNSFDMEELAGGWLNNPPQIPFDSTSYYFDNLKVLIDGTDFYIYGAYVGAPAYLVKYKSIHTVTTKNISSQSYTKKELTYSVVQGACKIIDADNAKGSLHVYDLNGRELFSGAYQTNTTIDMSSYNPGLYIAKFESDQQVISTIKVVITGK